MIKRKKQLLLLLSAVILLIGTFIGGILFHNGITANAVPAMSSKVIANEITNISEYASLEYRYTNVGKFQDRVDFYGWQVPLTSKSFIITYDGVIKLGVKGEDIVVEQKGNKLHIKLPPAEILSHEIYEDTLEVLDQTKNIFNPIQIEDYTNFSKDQKSEMEQKAADKGLLTEASERAKSQISGFLKSMIQDEDMEIVFD